MTPNFKRLKDLTGISKRENIMKKLDDKIEKVRIKYLKEDLLPLFSDEKFVDNFVKNFKKLYQSNRLL